MTYTARHVPVHHGPAAWNSILPDQGLAVPLDHTTTADITIIGGGFAGLSTARRALQLDPTLKVIILEAGRIAEGGTGRNTGFMIDLPHELTSEDYAGHGDDRTLTVLNRQAIAFGRAAVEEYGIDRNFFDPAGKINGAGGPKADRANQSYAAHLTALGETYERLDAQHMQEITGSRHYVSGLYTPGTVMLQPAGYVRGLADGLRADVQIFENTPALAFARRGTAWHITTQGGAIDTGTVILANNGHLESFGIAKGRLMHVFLFASMTRPLSDAEQHRLGGQPRWGVTPSDPMGTTLRRIDTGQGGHRIITRTYASLRSSMQSTQRDIDRAARLHLRKFNMHFPHLNGVDQEHVWAGHLCLSKNNTSLCGPVEDGVYAACVQNGLGTTRGTLTGIAAAEMALGTRSDITDYFTAQAKLPALPPEPLRAIGANAYLKWQTWRAMSE